MKAFLMHRDRDFDLERELPVNEEELIQDLDLSALFAAMALGDGFLSDVARRGVLSSLDDPKAILYRQQVLADCLEQPTTVRAMYELAVEAIEGKKRAYGFAFRESPDSLLSGSIRVLELFVEVLKRLRGIGEEHAGEFRSEGFVRFFAMLAEELDDDYFETIEGHLKELRFRRGVLMSAELGRGNKGTGYVLRRPRPQSWKERISFRGTGSLGFRIAARDEHGFRALAELQAKGINLVANALAQSTEHILGFFTMVRAELAFYVGCLNLHAQLTEKGEPTCFPVPVSTRRRTLSAQGLYDVCLSLHLDGRAVGNDVNADDKALVMITGANQGGKSTFLRSLGLAQLLMQCGMFVPGESFRADVCAGVFTHFKREEDVTMTSGKLDEELSRMSDIADGIAPRCLLLCNESFASTNEREGSEIARQVIRAMMEGGVKVVFVTHQFDLAQGLHRQELDTALFLRAERGPNGRRTFRLVEGEPLSTSYGGDTYRRIFGMAGEAPAAPAVSGGRG